MADDTTPAAELYARVTVEFERLEERATDAHEWLKLATTVLEAVMKCQALVIDKQRAVLERARSEGDTDAADLGHKLRAEARDVLSYVERLTELYNRIQEKLTPPSGS